MSGALGPLSQTHGERREDVKRRIAECSRRNPELTMKALRERFGCGHDTVRAALREAGIVMDGHRHGWTDRK